MKHASITPLPVDRHFNCIKRCHIGCAKVCKLFAYPRLVASILEDVRVFGGRDGTDDSPRIAAKRALLQELGEL